MALVALLAASGFSFVPAAAEEPFDTIEAVTTEVEDTVKAYEDKAQCDVPSAGYEPKKYTRDCSTPKTAGVGGLHALAIESLEVAMDVAAQALVGDYQSIRVSRFADADADGRADLLAIYSRSPSLCLQYIQTDYINSNNQALILNDANPTTSAVELNLGMMFYSTNILLPGPGNLLHIAGCDPPRLGPSMAGFAGFPEEPHNVTVRARLDPAGQCRVNPSPEAVPIQASCQLLQVFSPTSTDTDGNPNTNPGAMTQHLAEMLRIEQWTRAGEEYNNGPHLVIRWLEFLTKTSPNQNENGVRRQDVRVGDQLYVSGGLHSAPYDIANIHLVNGAIVASPGPGPVVAHRLDFDDDNIITSDELIGGSNPLNYKSTLEDRDGDGVPNGPDQYEDDFEKFRDFNWRFVSVSPNSGTLGSSAIDETINFQVQAASDRPDHVHLQRFAVHYVTDIDFNGQINDADLQRVTRKHLGDFTCAAHDCSAPNVVLAVLIDDVGKVNADSTWTKGACSPTCAFQIPSGTNFRIHIEMFDDGSFAGIQTPALSATWMTGVMQVQPNVVPAPTAPDLVRVYDSNNDVDRAGAFSDHVTVEWSESGTAVRTGVITHSLSVSRCSPTPVALAAVGPPTSLGGSPEVFSQTFSLERNDVSPRVCSVAVAPARATITTTEVFDRFTRSTSDTIEFSIFNNARPALSAPVREQALVRTEDVTRTGATQDVETSETPPAPAVAGRTVRFYITYVDLNAGGTCENFIPSYVKLVITGNGSAFASPWLFDMARVAGDAGDASCTGPAWGKNNLFQVDVPVVSSDQDRKLTIGKTYSYHFIASDKDGNLYSKPVGVDAANPSDPALDGPDVRHPSSGTLSVTVKKDTETWANQQAAAAVNQVDIVKAALKAQGCDLDAPATCPTGIRDRIEAERGCDVDQDGKPAGKPKCQDGPQQLVQGQIDSLVENVTNIINQVVGNVPGGMPNPWAGTRCGAVWSTTFGQSCPNDMDQDGFADAVELAAASDKNNPFSTPLDPDADLLPQAVESTSIEINVWEIRWVNFTAPGANKPACGTNQAHCHGLPFLRADGTKNIIVHGGPGSSLLEIAETSGGLVRIRANENRYAWTVLGGLIQVEPFADGFHLLVNAEDSTRVMDLVVHLNRLGVAGQPMIDLYAFGANGPFGNFAGWHEAMRFEVMTNPIDVFVTGQACGNTMTGVHHTSNNQWSPSEYRQEGICPKTERKSLYDILLDYPTGRYGTTSSDASTGFVAMIHPTVPATCPDGTQAAAGPPGVTWVVVKRVGNEWWVCGQIQRPTATTAPTPFGTIKVPNGPLPFLGVHRPSSGPLIVWMDKDQDRTYDAGEEITNIPNIEPPCNPANPTSCADTTAVIKAIEDAAQCDLAGQGYEPKKYAGDCSGLPGQKVNEQITLIENQASCDVPGQGSEPPAGRPTCQDKATSTVGGALVDQFKAVEDGADCDIAGQGYEPKKYPAACTDLPGTTLNGLVGLAEANLGCDIPGAGPSPPPAKTCQQLAMEAVEVVLGLVKVVEGLAGQLVPMLLDIDGDGFQNTGELFATPTRTNPFNADSRPGQAGLGFPGDWDGDGFLDTYEVQNGSDPTKRCSTPSNKNGGIRATC